MATGLGVGAVSSLNFGLDYQVLPVSLIGASFSLAIFPVLSGAFADADRAAFRSVLARNVVTIALLTTLAAAGLFVLSGTLVEVLLGGGRFEADDVARTSTVVAAFALSIPFDALAYPLSRGLYATHDTIRQVAGSFFGLAVVVVTTQALVGSLDEHDGLERLEFPHALPGSPFAETAIGFIGYYAGGRVETASNLSDAELAHWLVVLGWPWEAVVRRVITLDAFADAYRANDTEALVAALDRLDGMDREANVDG